MVTARRNTIGFIGLGAMGNHMLNSLVSKVTRRTPPINRFAVFDVNEKPVKDVVERHKVENPMAQIIRCSSPAEVATHASYIISMVPDSRHVQEVYTGANGVIRALECLPANERSQTICIDHSTIEQSTSREVALKVREIGADLLDAPVSGGVAGAKSGTLAIMVGGRAESFEAALPVLSAMARKVVHCGDLGTGLAAKISNNLLLGITMLGLSEATLLGRSLGLEPQVLADIINSSTGRCWSSEVNHPDASVQLEQGSTPAHRDYEGGFVTKLAHKDLGLAVKAADSVRVPLKLGKTCEEVFRPLASSQEWANRDFSVILKALSIVRERSREGRASL